MGKLWKVPKSERSDFGALLYSTVFDNCIRQYLTLFDFKKGIRFLFETNRLACFVLIWVPNSETKTEYFRIIFPDRIVGPSLVCVVSRQKLHMFAKTVKRTC